MKVSIITVVFNAESTLKDCIESVVNQTYKNIEYIVIDGKSTDASCDIAKSYGDKIDIFVSEPDAGIYDAMNKGVALATGTVVGILNADDYYCNDKVIEKIVSQFEEKHVDALYADLVYVDTKNTSIVKRYWKSGSYDIKNFLYGWMPPHPTFYLKNTYYEQFGGYRLDLGTAADYELMLRMLYKHRLNVAYLPEVTIKMRVGGSSNESWGRRYEANRNDRKAWKINDLKPYWFTILLKPFRKIGQYLSKPTTVK